MPDNATPLFRFRDKIFMKLESESPGFSHKGRVAQYVINEALNNGDLLPGESTVIESTGGNFGIGLALVCSRLGINCELAANPSYSRLKRQILSRLGATLIGFDYEWRCLSPSDIVGRRMQNSKEKNYFWPNQFQNRDCVATHYYKTGLELIKQLQVLGFNHDDPISFVCGAGTGATLNGVSARLREYFKDVEVVYCEPSGCDARAGIYEAHRMEGWCVGRFPPFLDGLKMDLRIECDEVGMEDARNQVLVESGIVLGNTAAATVSAALFHLADKPKRWVVTIACDNGLWYV